MDYEIELVKPTETHKDAVLGYKKEFTENNEYIHGSAWLTDTDDFDAWLANVRFEEGLKTHHENKVPASEYLAIRKSDNKLVGLVSLRRELNDYLEKFGGHIGYSVRRSERRKGYATQMLEIALLECKTFSIPKVLVTCDKNNIASETVIKLNGGVFESETVDPEGVTLKRYWITVS